MSQVEVYQRSIDDIVPVNATVKEFDEPYDSAHFEQRIKGKKHLILIGQVDGKPAGYMVSYEDDRYSDSFYLWMAGVNPEYRGRGVLKAMMDYQENWARNEGYQKLVLKTRNARREMLSYLVRYGFNFIGVIPKAATEDTEILAEKLII